MSSIYVHVCKFIHPGGFRHILLSILVSETSLGPHETPKTKMIWRRWFRAEIPVLLQFELPRKPSEALVAFLGAKNVLHVIERYDDKELIYAEEDFWEFDHLDKGQ